jgi:hypothetical protein
MLPSAAMKADHLLLRSRHAARTSEGICRSRRGRNKRLLALHRPDGPLRVYRIDRATSQTIFISDDGTTFAGEGTNGDEAIMIRNYLATSDLIVDWARARPIVDPEPKAVVSAEEPVP